jgi:agmatinase
MAILKFVTDIFSRQDANVVVLRVNCPKSLIDASRMVESFDIDSRMNLLENARIFDAGETKLNSINDKVGEVIDSGKLPLLLAERHVASLEAVKALPKDVKLIAFDAHADMKDEYAEGDYRPVNKRVNYATWLRRACEIINPKNICIIGVRSCDEDEFDFMSKSGIRYFTSSQVRNHMEGMKLKLLEFLKGSTAYVSIDMDVFDPSIAPAVENNEPNGISYDDFLQLAEVIGKNRIVGCDLVEIRPMHGNRITEFLAIKVIFKMLSLIFR